MAKIKLFYNGNANLKPVGIPIQFTAEQAAEYIKCKQDPIYFIKTYCTIVSLDRGAVNFDMHPYQERLVNAIHNNRFVLGKIGRQMGKTITVACYLIHYAIFNDSKEICILANKAAAAREVLSRVQFAYEYLPTWLQQGIKTWNKGNIELENGSKIYTGATTASGPRGKSISMLYIDEAAIIENGVADSFFAATYPTISSGKNSKIIQTSTPLGFNHFWKFWNDSEEGRNKYVRVEAHYKEHPDRTDEWAKEQLMQLGQLKFNQEVLCHWLGSSATLIDSNTIGKLSAKTPIFSKDGLDIFENPIKNDGDGTADGVYCMVVDVSKGLGADYSAFCVMDITKIPYRMVARFRSNSMPPMMLPTMIHRVATEYNKAYVLCEVNSSEQVAHILHYELEYENMMTVKRTQRGQEISQGFAGGALAMGVNTDKKVKRIGCFNFKSLVEEGKLLFWDAVAISEISTFIEKKESFAADDGYTDDVVMTMVLFAWLTTQDYFKDLNNVDIRKALYEQQMAALEANMTPFGFIMDGREEEMPLNF
jgi:hypothetical protein